MSGTNASAGRILFVDHAGVLGGAELSLLDLASSFGADADVVLLADGPFRTALEAKGVPVGTNPTEAASIVVERLR